MENEDTKGFYDKEQSKLDNNGNDVEKKEVENKDAEKEDMENDEKNAKEDQNDKLKDKDVIEESLAIVLGTSSAIATKLPNQPNKNQTKFYSKPCHVINYDRHKMIVQKKTNCPLSNNQGEITTELTGN